MRDELTKEQKELIFKTAQHIFEGLRNFFEESLEEGYANRYNLKPELANAARQGYYWENQDIHGIWLKFNNRAEEIYVIKLDLSGQELWVHTNADDYNGIEALRLLVQLFGIQDIPNLGSQELNNFLLS